VSAMTDVARPDDPGQPAAYDYGDLEAVLRFWEEARRRGWVVDVLDTEGWRVVSPDANTGAIFKPPCELGGAVLVAYDDERVIRLNGVSVGSAVRELRAFLGWVAP
jgi:hypothetical protein